MGLWEGKVGLRGAYLEDRLVGGVEWLPLESVSGRQMQDGRPCRGGVLALASLSLLEASIPLGASILCMCMFVCTSMCSTAVLSQLLWC